MPPPFLRPAVTTGIGLLAGMALAQQSPLTLEDALRLAKQNNGDVLSAQKLAEAARFDFFQARAALFPTLTANYQYNSDRVESLNPFGSGTIFNQDEGGVSGLRAHWLVLDTGERRLAIDQAGDFRDASFLDARQTLRTTLFSVTQDFYEALRSQELLKVARSQVDRAKALLDQTDARIAVQDAAKIEHQQAEVDYQNAQVDAITAENKVSTTAANLKADIGLAQSDDLPLLAGPSPTVASETIPNFASPDAPAYSTFVDQSLALRPDLLSEQKNLHSEDVATRLAKLRAGITGSLEANFDEQTSPDRLQNRTITFLLSYPIFDGSALRSSARAAAARRDSAVASYTQARRNAIAEIDAASRVFSQDQRRYAAADLAQQAALANYNAAQESYNARAYDLVQVQLAQTSLTTAQGNYVQALYDLLIAREQLKLAAGLKLQGE